MRVSCEDSLKFAERGYPFTFRAVGRLSKTSAAASGARLADKTVQVADDNAAVGSLDGDQNAVRRYGLAREGWQTVNRAGGARGTP